MANRLPPHLKTGCTTPDLAALETQQPNLITGRGIPKQKAEPVVATVAPTVARKLSKPAGSDLETAFLAAWHLVPGRPEPERNYRFHGTRKWRFDFAWLDAGVAVEIEGGTQGRRVKCQCCGAVVRARKGDGSAGRELRIGGGHNRGEVYRDNCAKYNAATLDDWTLLRYTTEDLAEKPVQVCEEIEQAINARGRS